LLRDKVQPWFPCTDDGHDLYVKDTYAYVKLAFEAYNLRRGSKPPDHARQLRDARIILEDMRAEVISILHAIQDRTRGDRPAPTCVIESEAKAWIKRISSHLKLAEAISP
jgi:hypothetical protein